MPSRTLLAGLGSASLVAGCAGSSPDPPEASCPDEGVTPVPFPERPVTLTEQTVREFVADFERAHVYARESESKAIKDISLDPQPDNVTRSSDGWSVRIETGLSVETCRDGARMVGDGYYTARYFLNESHIYRAQVGGAGPVPDPREEGTQIGIANES